MVGTAGSPDWSCSKELGENGSEQRVAGRGVTEALGVEETPVGANVRTKARRADKLQAGICPLEHVSEGTHHPLNRHGFSAALIRAAARG